MKTIFPCLNQQFYRVKADFHSLRSGESARRRYFHFHWKTTTRVDAKINKYYILHNQHNSKTLNCDWLLLLSGAWKSKILILHANLHFRSDWYKCALVWRHLRYIYGHRLIFQWMEISFKTDCQRLLSRSTLSFFRTF